MNFNILGRELKLSAFKDLWSRRFSVELRVIEDEIREAMKNGETEFYLSIGEIPEITYIPEKLWGFVNLKDLTINFEKHLTIPAKISLLKNLQHLTLYSFIDEDENRKLGNLSSGISVHENIRRLHKLETISIDCENIKELPEILFSSPNLEGISLSNYGLKELPEFIFKIRKLKSLEVNDAKITKISPQIGELVNLEILEINNTEVSSLPEEIGKLVNLKELVLSENRLSSLPSSLSNLRNLEHLNIEENEFEDLPEVSLYSSKLKWFSIEGNSFKNNPEILNMGIHELKKYFKLSSSFSLNIPVNLVTAFQQYLLFFREYLFSAKGITAKYDVFVVNNSLEVSVDFNQQLDENLFIEYLEEYLRFAKENSIGIIKIEGDPNPVEIDLLRLNLEVQISNLSNQLKLKEWQVKYLESELNNSKIEKDRLLNSFVQNISHALEASVDRSAIRIKCTNLIRRGRLKEVFEYLSECIEPQNSNYKEMILLSNRWSNFLKSQNIGTLTRQEHIQEYNMISSALLSLIEQIDDERKSRT